MSPPSGADKVSSCYLSSDSSSDSDCRRHQEEEDKDDYAASDDHRRRCPEEEEEDDYANDAGSQVTFDTTSMAGTDFLTPGGLNLFTVALPAKTEKLFAKDLPKIIKASGISKKNYRATINALNVGIGQLQKTAIAEISIARSIHNVAKEALKRGSKLLDGALKKVVKLEENLSKTKSTLANVSMKLCEAVFGQDAATAKKKTTSKTWKTTQKELGNVKKDLAEAKEELAGLKNEVESGASRRGRSGSRNKTRGDSMERLRKNERIKLDAFKLKSAIAGKNKEKEEKRKFDAKHDILCTIQALGGRVILLCRDIMVTATAVVTAMEGVAVGAITAKVAVAVAARARKEGVGIGVIAAEVPATAQEGGVATGIIAVAAAVGAGGGS